MVLAGDNKLHNPFVLKCPMILNKSPSPHVTESPKSLKIQCFFFFCCESFQLMLSCIALIEDNIAVNSCAILVSQQQVKCKSSIVSYSLPRRH